MNDAHAAVLVLVMAAATWLTRFLPFLVFRRRVPPYIRSLGGVLPAAIIGMLVVYCLKDVNPAAAPHGIPALIAAATVAGLQCWKRNSLISILGGTGVYMALAQVLA